MVAGIEKFREHFAGHEDHYAIIGGAGCDLLFDAAGFPFMIELFSRKPGTLELPDGAALTRIPVEEDIVSLSAILLDDGYYEALQAAERKVDGVTVIDEILLIPFKARAFLDMTAREKAGEKIDAKNIKKHRNDVFRLAQLLPKNASMKLADPIREDLRKFLEMAYADVAWIPRPSTYR